MPTKFDESHKLTPNHKLKSISIIIPVYNDYTGIQTTLRSLKQHLADRNNIEVIVCNDGGGSKITEILSEFPVIEARLSKNRGRSAARNAGIAIATGEIVIFLDADQTITKNWLNEGLLALNNADYVGGDIIIEPFDCSDIWEMKDHLISPFTVENCIRHLHFAPTANLFVRREVINAIGCFDERLLSAEDLDFGQRVYNAGFRQTFSCNAVTLHPARNKTEQLRKMRRLGKGVADKFYFKDDKTPLFIFGYSMVCILKLPLELSFRIMKELFSDEKLPRKKRLQVVVIDKYCKFLMLCNVIVRSYQLFTR